MTFDTDDKRFKNLEMESWSWLQLQLQPLKV